MENCKNKYEIFWTIACNLKSDENIEVEAANRTKAFFNILELCTLIEKKDKPLSFEDEKNSLLTQLLK